jgi:hypothetical protein
MLYIGAMLVLTGCTSSRSLSRKFSEKPTTITTQFVETSYVNTHIDTAGRYVLRQRSLWDKLAEYRSVQDTLPVQTENARILLSLENNKTLRVSAYDGLQATASFEIPVRKRRKYLILENKSRIIPIPLIYFSVKEDKTILAPLKNKRIGIYDYSDETLWILFFGASKTGRSISEYQEVADPE